MSYDIHLEADLGGGESAVLAALDFWNYTSNCAPMWRAAGADLAEFDGKLASDCLPLLEAALADMRANPAKYEAMNPENGWGSYESLLPALEELRTGFAAAPKATVRVWR